MELEAVWCGLEAEILDADSHGAGTYLLEAHRDLNTKRILVWHYITNKLQH